MKRYETTATEPGHVQPTERLPVALSFQRMMATIWALAAVAIAVATLVAALQLRTGWALLGLILTVPVTVRALFLWRYVDGEVRLRYPRPAPNVQPATRPTVHARGIPFSANGAAQEPIDLGPAPDAVSPTGEPVVEGLGITVGALEDFVREAFGRGLAESAWRRPYTLRPDGIAMTGPLLRDMRNWLGRHGLARKEGRARNAPWVLTGTVEELVAWLREHVQ